MQVPSHVARALYRLHPQLRFAWMGRERSSADELNAGTFAVVQLYHNRDAGTPDDPNSYREFWDVGVTVDAFGGPGMARMARGPIFARDGSLRRDWDPLMRQPMLIAALDAYDLADEDAEDGQKVTHYDVFSGRVVHTIRQWLLSPYDRFVRSAKAKGRGFKNKVDDMVGEMSKDLWREAQRPDAVSTTLSKKHAKEDPGVKQLQAWKDKGGLALEDTFLPPPLPKQSAGS